MKTSKIIKNFNSGALYQESTSGQFYFGDVDGASRLYASSEVATEEYFIKQAYGYLGSAIRDNSRAEKIAIGRKIDEGTWEEEN